MRKHTALFTPHHVALAVACLCMGLARAQTAPAPTQLPSGGKVVGGNASISASGSTLNINQSSNRAAIDWNSFNVGSDARVNFNQPSASSVTLNRVVGGDPSQIMGRINAPGQVFISNASGVIFGAKSQVDVGGLLVTTLGISNEDFMAGKSSFSGNGSNAKVVNQGTLQATLGGFVALLAPEVRNEGIIVAHQGSVALASGNKVTLVFSGNSLTTVEVEQGIVNALVENKHMLMADGGLVLMTARSASALMGSLVKNSGTVQAQTIANKNGRILLMGDMTSGTTQVEGKLDASAPNGGDGGFIETSAARVNIGPQATVTTQSAQGKYGQWLVDPVDFTVADSGGDMTANTLQNNLGTSNVTLMSAAGATNGLGDVNINSAINWSANTTLTLTASNNVNINANMMATGNTAGLVINPSTTHTSGGVTQTANSTGVFNLLFGKYIKLSGSAPSLSISGQSYTVINSLGTATSSGDGSLQGMRGNLSGYYALGSNIDASATSGWNAGAGFTPIGQSSNFNGIFQGLGNNVSNLRISSPSSVGVGQAVGMFYNLGATSRVENFGLLSASITALGAPSAIGALVGTNYGTILKSFAEGSVTSQNNTQSIGGLAGSNAGTIESSYASVNVTSGSSTLAIGGLAGDSTGTIKNSYATGDVSAGNNSGGNGFAYQGGGGLVGYLSGNLSESFASGNVNVSGYAGDFGGLIGYANNAVISKSYAKGNVTSVGGRDVGGFVGNVVSSTISDAFSVGNVTAPGASWLGGFVGSNWTGGVIRNSYTSSACCSTGTGFSGGNIGTLQNNFWNTTVSNDKSAGNSDQLGITTTQMQTVTPFTNAGWSPQIWRMIGSQNNGFPVLSVGASAIYIKFSSGGSSTYGSNPNWSGSGTLMTYSSPRSNTEVWGYGLSGTPTLSTTLTATTPAGVYPVSYVSGLQTNTSSSGQTMFGPLPGDPTNWTILKKPLTGSITPGYSIYGGALNPGVLSLIGVVNNDSVTGSTPTINTAGNTSTSGNLKAGTYTGIQSVGSTLSGADAANYTFSGATGSYTVSQKSLTGSITNGSSVYGAALAPGTATITSGIVGSDQVSPATVTVNTTGNTSTSGNLKAGTYSGIQSVNSLVGSDAANYTFSGASGNYTVSPLALAAVLGAGSSVYGASLVPGALTLSNLVGSDQIITQPVQINTAGNTSTSGNLKAGTYTGIQSVGSTLSGADAANYTFSGASGNYTVSQKSLTGSIASGTSVYGAALAPGTASITSGIVGSDQVSPATVTVNTAGNTSTSGNLKAGTYSGIQSVSTLVGADATNYTFSGATANYTVSPLALAAVLGAGSSVYGASLVPGTVTFSNKVGSDTVTAATPTINTAGNTSTSGNLKAGTYTGIQSVGSTLAGTDAANYTFSGATGSYTVSQKSLTGNIASGTSVYGAALAPGTATITSGIVGSDQVSPATVTVNTAGNTSTSGNLKAGTYSNIQSVNSLVGSDAANYTFPGATANYTVSPLALVGAIGAGSTVYGASLVPGTVTFSNKVGSDTVTAATPTINTTGNTSTSGNLKAGTYTGIQSVGSTLSGADAANYTFAGTTGNYTVSKATLGGSIASGTSVYGAALAPGTASITSGIVGSDQVSPGTVTVNTAGNTSTSGNLKAGTYNNKQALALNGADASNYIFGGTVGNYTVTPLALAGVLGAGSTVYGASLVPGALTLSNLVGSDLIITQPVQINTAGNTSTSGNLKAGTYTGIQSVGSTLSGTDAANYTFSGATGSYTVSQKSLTGSIASGTSVYGAALAPGTASITSGIVGSDQVSPATVTVNTAGNTSTSGNLKAGTYSGIQSVSTLVGADATNYTFSGATANYTVSPLALAAVLGAGSSVYGASLVPGTVTFSNKVGSDTVTAATPTINTAGNTSTSGNLKAGTYTGIQSVGSTLAGTDAANYTFSGATGSYTVSQKSLTGNIASGTSVYGAALAPGTATITSGIVGSDQVSPATVTVNTAGNTSTSGNLKAGTYSNIQSVNSLVGSDAANYTFSGASGNYTVSQKSLTGSITNGSSVYGAALAPGTASITSGIVGSDQVSPATVTVNTAGNTSTSGNLKAGTYSGIQSVSTLVGADATNYTFAGATGNYTVSPLALVGAIGAGSTVYGASLVSGALTLSNLVGSDQIITQPVQINIAGNTSTSGNLKAGTYTGIQSVGSTLSGTDAANYTFSGATGNYTVSKATLGGSIASGTSVYGAALAPGTATITSGIVGSDQVSPGTVTVNTAGNTSTSGNLKAGTYNNKQALALNGADASNYIFGGTVGNYTVTPLALAGVLGAGSTVYGASLVPGVVNFSNKVSSDIVTAATPTINTTGNTSTSGNLKAGTYTGIQSVGSTLSGADAANYTFAGTTGNYTVTPLTLAGVLGAGSSVYGASLAPGTVTFSNKVGSDIVTAATPTINTTGNTSTSGNLKAGTYTGIQSVGSTLSGADAANYTFAGTTGNYTVSKATLGGSIASGTSVYGAALAPGTASITSGLFSKVTGGVTTTDVVTLGTVGINTTGNTSTSGNLKAGTYTGIQSVGSTLSGADSANYTFAGTTGNYTVTPLALVGAIGAGSSAYGASLVPGAVSFSNKLPNDQVSGTASVNTAGTLNGYPVIDTYTQTASSTLSGADASNYTFAGTTTATKNYAVNYPDVSASPLTLTSAQMAVITTNSIAQFTPAQLQQLTPTQLQSMSTTQLNAIPLAKFSYLTATQLGNLTNAQVAALPNSYIQSLSLSQLSGMTASQLGSMGLSQLAQLSPAQISNMSASQIKGLTLTQLQNLSKPQLLALSNAQFASMTDAQLQALATLPLDKSLSSEAKAAAEALADKRTTDVISFQSTQRNNLNPGRYGNFEAPVSNQLSLADIKGIQYLNPSQIPTLAPEKITAVSASQLKSLTANQLVNLNGNQLKALTANQLSALSADQLGSFSDNQLSALSPSQWAALSENQIASLTPTQLRVAPATAFAKMRDSQLQSLSPTQLVNLSTDVFLALNKNQLGCLTCNQLKSLKPSQMADLPLAVFKDLIKKKSDCMSAQQLAGLSQEQLQYMLKIQLPELNKEQLQALDATQLQSLSAAQLQKLKSDQWRQLLPEQVAALNEPSVRTLVKSLSPEQLQALAPAQIRLLQPADIVKLSPLQIQALTPTQIVAITPQALAQLNKPQWREWTAEQIRSLQPTQLKALTPEQLTWLSPVQLNALTPAQLAQLLPSQIASLTAKQQQILLPEQLGELQPEQLQAFANPLVLGKPKTAADLVIDKDFQQLAADQFTPQKITLLLPAQLRLLTPQQISGLNKNQLSTLAPTQWQLLNPEQLSAISPDVWKSLDPAVLKNLSPVQLSALPPSLWQALTPAQIQALPVTVLAKLSPEQLRALNALQTNALDKEQLSALSTQQLQSLTPQQLAAWNGAQLQKLNASQVAALTPAQLNQLSESQWKSLTPDQVKQLQPAQLSALNPKLLNALPNEQLQSLTGGQLAALSPTQLSALKPAQWQALTETQIALLTPMQLASLSPEQIRSLAPIQINVLTPVFFTNISPSLLQALSLNQWAAVSPQSIAAMDTPQIQSLTIVQVGNISPAQLEGLSGNQLQAFTPLQLNSIPPRMLWSMSNQQLQSFTPEQVAQFTPAQLNQLVPVLTPQQLTALGRDKQAALDNPSSRQQSQPVPRPAAEKPPNRPPPVLQR